MLDCLNGGNVIEEVGLNPNNAGEKGLRLLVVSNQTTRKKMKLENKNEISISDVVIRFRSPLPARRYTDAARTFFAIGGRNGWSIGSFDFHILRKIQIPMRGIAKYNGHISPDM